MRKQRIVLEHHAEAALFRQEVVDALLVEPDFAFGRRHETGNDAKRCGLTASARPEERHELSAADLQRQVIEHGLAAVPLSDIHAQLIDGIGHIPRRLPNMTRARPKWAPARCVAYCYFLT